MLAIYKRITEILVDQKLKSRFNIIVILSIIQAIFEAIVISALPIVINALIFKKTINNYSTPYAYIENYDPISITITFILLFILKNIFNLFYNFYSSRFITNAQCYLNTRIFTHHLYKSYPSFTSYNTSEYIKDITNNSNNYVNFSLSPLISLVSESFILLFIFSTLIFINFQLTFIFIFSSFLIYLFINYFTKNILADAGKSNERLYADLIKYIKESYLSFKEIHLYNLQPHFISNFNNISKRLAFGISKNMFYGSLPRILVESFFIIFILINLASMFTFSASELIISFGTFGFASLRIIPSLSKILTALSSIKFGNSSCESLSKLILPNYNNNNGNYVKYSDSVTLLNISHKYDNNLILSNINLTINSGDFIAIIGDSGSGKTTLLNIILGLITPSSGQVLSDNLPISLSPHSWRSNLGYVPQSIHLIDEDIYKNVALGTDYSEIDKDKIDSILKSLSLFHLSDNSNTNKLQLGELSANISGGQSQRIGIAKALYRNPKILILDEFTSALDDINQDKILMLIKTLKVTVIMVTHRLNSLSHCNRVFKLQNNSLVQLK